MRRLVFLALLGAAACGGDDGGNNTIDAAKQSDAAPPAATVMEVSPCPATVDGTVTTSDSSFQFMPAATTIPQNGVVKFMTSLDHNVVPGSSAMPDGDPGLSVGFNTTKCLKFTAKGKFDFHCGPHSFVGSVTVQ